MQPIRILYEHCVPCASTAWWWHLDPVLAATARGIDVYYAAMLTALDAAGALRGLMPRAATYVLGGCLLPWFMLHPAAAASKAYGMWCAPDMYAMQTLYAPMQWPACKAAMRLCCGQDIEHTEQSVAGVRVLMLRRKDTPPPPAARTAVASAAREAEQAPPEVPSGPHLAPHRMPSFRCPRAPRPPAFRPAPRPASYALLTMPACPTPCRPRCPRCRRCSSCRAAPSSPTSRRSTSSSSTSGCAPPAPRCSTSATTTRHRRPTPRRSCRWATKP